MFPFQDISKATLTKSSDTIEKLLKLRDHFSILGFDTSDLKLEALTLSLEFILKTADVYYHEKTFCDCFGNRSEGCLYASVYGFRELVSIEMIDQSIEESRILLNQLVSSSVCDASYYHKMHTVAGVLWDYIDVLVKEKYDFFFLDVTRLQSSMIDEGIFITQFLTLCSKAVAGSFMILLTSSTEKHNLDDYLIGANNIFILKLATLIGVNETDIEFDQQAFVSIYLIS